MRENRTYGLMREGWREPVFYSTRLLRESDRFVCRDTDSAAQIQRFAQEAHERCRLAEALDHLRAQPDRNHCRMA